MHSVINYPDRGKWGKSSWRGNASGHVYKDLFLQLKPKVFVDPMVGSGTSVEVANEMGIEGYGLDLHGGFNAVRNSILQAVGKPADLVFSHPPYSGMVVYSGNVWGKGPVADDLSRCVDDNDFCEKLALVMFNQRDATKDGGHYGVLIGDWRRGGVYSSYQAEIIARMPSNELASIIIKMQHNCTSDANQYAPMTMPRIMHEYLVLFKKKAVPTLVLLSGIAKQQQQRLTGTWRAIVRAVLVGLGGAADLASIYATVSANAPEKLASNDHWKEKIRQTLNSTEGFKSVEKGRWALA